MKKNLWLIFCGMISLSLAAQPVTNPAGATATTQGTNTTQTTNAPASKTVKPNRLKIRGGPGENYSVLGFLKKGDVINEISTKGDWMEIEAPAEASAYVAAQYLKQEETPATVATTTPTTPPSTSPTN